MLAKHGSDKAISDAMRERQIKSRENYSGTGGFASLKQADPELHKELSSKGGRISKRT